MCIPIPYQASIHPDVKPTVAVGRRKTDRTEHFYGQATIHDPVILISFLVDELEGVSP